MPHSLNRLCQLVLVAMLAALVPLATPVRAAGPFTVNSTADDGDAAIGNGSCATAANVCTLRAAIQETNALSGPTSINFNIPTSDGGYNASQGVWTIRPFIDDLPSLTRGGTTLNASSQPGGRASGPKIELNGALRQGDTNGFTLQSSGNVIDGFVINGFLRGSSINRGIGIFINDDAADNNIIRNNWIGLAVGGVNANGNDYAGIYIRGGDGNQILANVISGNGSATTGVTSNIIIGVAVDSDLYVTDDTTVAGNFIGTNPAGTAAIGGGNPQSGVRVAFRTNDTLIGGANAAARNIISGNNNASAIPNRSGVYVDGTNQTNTVVRGNYIGTNAAGTGAVPNYYGVSIVDGANNTVVDGNVISGNTDNGVNAAQELRSTSGLMIQNNIIGLSVAGAALGNGGEGVALIRRQDKDVTVGVTGSTVQGNTISANGRNGILIGNDGLAGSLFANNVIIGNAIGTRIDKTGTDSTLVNGRYAIEVASGTTTRIGGSTAAERNVIAARTNFAGLHLTGPDVSGSQVLGNSFGLTANGSNVLTAEATARATYGVLIDLGSNGNTVGGGNLIGANRYGVHVTASSSTTIVANNLGVAGAGNEQFGVWLLNASNTTIGGAGSAQGNTLTSNGRNGIFAEGSSSGLTIGFNTVTSSVQEGIVLRGVGVSGAVLNSNSITGNQSDGVLVDGATGVRITRTTTNNNGGDGIRLANGGNANRAAPTLSATLVTGPNNQPAVTGTASGCASPGCVVEIFSSNTRADGEGPRFLASGTANPVTGAFTIEIPGCDRFLTATARDPQNNTSPFTTPMVDTVTGCTSAKPTLSAGTPASSAAAPQEVAPGSSITFKHTLTNSGGLPGTFTISVTPGAQNWPAQVSPTSVSLAANQSVDIDVTVTVPQNSRGGPPPEAVTVTASVGGETASQTDYVQAPQVFGFDLNPVSKQFTSGGSIPPLDFVHTVTNTGNGFDTITLSVVNDTLPAGTTFTFPNGQQCANLTRNASCDITIRVQLPANSTGGSFSVTGTGKNGATKTVTDVALTQSVIPQLTVFPRRDAFPGDVVTFVHTLKNIGNQAGTFTITLAEPNPLDGWVYSLSSPASVDLAPNEETTVTVTATVPGIGNTGAISGTVKTATLQATANSGALATAADSVRVLLKPQFSFGPAATSPVSGFPQTTVSFTHVLQNTSNGDDRFNIAVTPTSGLENVTITPVLPISVPRGGSVQVVISARIKAGTPASAGSEQLTVVATSLSTPAAPPQQQVDAVTVLGATVPALSVTPAARTTAPGAAVRFTYTLTNIGNQSGTFDAPTFTLPNAQPGWSAAVLGSPACLTASLAPNATCSFDVDVTVPAGAFQGSNSVKTTVTSATTPTAEPATATAYVVVTAVPGVQFVPDQSGTTGPNDPITYQHSLTNTGNVTDTFTFTAQAPNGWSVPTPATLDNIAPGQTVQVDVVVTPPQIVAAGTVGDVTITAHSATNPKPAAAVVDSTTIAAVDAAELTPNQQTVNGAGGQTIFFYPQLRNTGSTSISYDLSVTSAGWTTLVTPTTTLSLQPGATEAVTISVQIPAGTPVGVDNAVTLNVTKQGEPGTPLATGNYTATTRILGSLLKPARNDGTALPGATIVYTHTLQNISGVAGTFTLRTVSTNGWKVSAEPASVFLDANESRNIQVTVVVPAGLPAGVQDYSYVEVQSLSDPALNARGTEVTTVGELVAMSLSPVQSLTTTPGSTVDLAHRLINAGNTPDTYTIEATSERGWPVAIIVPAGNTVTLLPNANFPIEVRVQVPADVAPGTIDRITVRAISQNDPRVTASVVNTLFYPSMPQQAVQPYMVALPLVVK